MVLGRSEAVVHRQMRYFRRGPTWSIARRRSSALARSTFPRVLEVVAIIRRFGLEDSPRAHWKMRRRGQARSTAHAWRPMRYHEVAQRTRIRASSDAE